MDSFHGCVWFFPRWIVLPIYWCTKCHSCPWSGVQSGGHIQVWDVLVAHPGDGAVSPGVGDVDVMSDLGWLINSSPMLGPSGEVDWGTSGAANCGSALLLQSWGPTLPGAKFLWGLLVLCGLGDFLNAKGVFYGWVVFLGQSFSRFLPKRRQFFSRCLFLVPLHPFFHLPQEPCAQPTAAKAGPAWPAVLSRANQTRISKSTFFLVLQRGIWIGQGNWTIVTPPGFHVPVSETGQGREQLSFMGRLTAVFSIFLFFKCYYYWLNTKLLSARNGEWVFWVFFFVNGLNLQL